MASRSHQRQRILALLVGLCLIGLPARGWTMPHGPGLPALPVSTPAAAPAHAHAQSKAIALADDDEDDDDQDEEDGDDDDDDTPSLRAATDTGVAHAACHDTAAVLPAAHDGHGAHPGITASATVAATGHAQHAHPDPHHHGMACSCSAADGGCAACHGVAALPPNTGAAPPARVAELLLAQTERAPADHIPPLPERPPRPSGD